MESTKSSLNGFRIDTEFKDVPVAFVNALRRILLAEIPTVVVSNVQILENTSSMTHEMIRHRMEMLPVNVKAEEAAVIRDTKLEVRYFTSPDAREVTTADFMATGPRSDILLPDRDLGTPLLFINLKPHEALHIKASLSVVSHGASQVCVSTFRNHIDPDVARVDKDTFVALAGDDILAQREAARSFDAFHVQRSFHRNKETGRPDWFDFTVESIGVTPAADLLKKAAEILKTKLTEWTKNPILREEAGWYRIEAPGDTFTVGQLVQEMMYAQALVDFVSVDIGHPLVPKLCIRFHTKTSEPDAVVQRFITEASTLCENVLKGV
jgi:DNA-directed RNA polymerase subunit L